MKFFKENSYDIVRLLINQIGITIFSLVLYTALQFDLDPATTLTIKICLSVFATLFYLTLLYTAAWEFGAKDKLRIDSGKYKKQPAKGALMSFCANLPNFILAIGALVCFLVYFLLASQPQLLWEGKGAKHNAGKDNGQSDKDELVSKAETSSK